MIYFKVKPSTWVADAGRESTVISRPAWRLPSRSELPSEILLACLCGTLGDQKGASDPLALKMQVLVSY